MNILRCDTVLHGLAMLAVALGFTTGLLYVILLYPVLAAIALRTATRHELPGNVFPVAVITLGVGAAFHALTQIPVGPLALLVPAPYVGWSLIHVVRHHRTVDATF